MPEVKASDRARGLRQAQAIDRRATGLKAQIRAWQNKIVRREVNEWARAEIARRRRKILKADSSADEEDLVRIVRAYGLRTADEAARNTAVSYGVQWRRRPTVTDDFLAQREIRIREFVRDGQTELAERIREKLLRYRGVKPVNPSETRDVFIPEIGVVAKPRPSPEPTAVVVVRGKDLVEAASEPSTTATIKVGGIEKYVTFELAPRDKFNDRELVRVRVDALDAAWQRDPSFYIPRGGGGAEIEGRRAGFAEFIADHDSMHASAVNYNPQTQRIGFLDGRHRFSIMRDSGTREVYVAVEPEEKADIVRDLGAPEPEPAGPSQIEIEREARRLAGASGSGSPVELPHVSIDEDGAVRIESGAARAAALANVTDSIPVTVANDEARRLAEELGADLFELSSPPEFAPTILELTREIYIDAELAGSFSPARAEMVARTEINSAENFGILEGYRAAGVTHMQWITITDKRARDTHRALDGEIVEVGDVWTTIDGNALAYPGDPDAPPEETINCRCVTRAIMREEQ